ncbi:MAG TPA: hemolysin family protein [Polyangiaceae bacterium]
MLLATLPAVLAAVSAAASWSITTLSAARRAALRDTLEGGAKRALDRYLESGPVIEARWLVIRALGTSLSALLAVSALPVELGAWRIVVAAMISLFAYALPSEIARALVMRSAERTAPFLLQAVRPLELVAAPIAAPIVWLGRLVGGQFERISAPAPGVTETEVELIVNEGELNGSLGHDQSEMIRNVLDFGDATAGQLMVPRPQVTAFDIATDPNAALRQIVESQHSRYPVYKDTIDNIVGVLYAKDLLRLVAENRVAEAKLESLVHQPVAFVPDSQLATRVLKDMRVGKHHMAVVVDEFGGFSGILTLEDLLEEIVGDIRDEHDSDEPPIVDLGDGKLMVDASVSITDLARYLGVELPEDGDYHTLAGLIVAELGHVPEPGAKLTRFGLEFTISDADERRIAKVEIQRLAPPESIAPRSSSRITAA